MVKKKWECHLMPHWGLTYETKTVHFPGSLMGSTLLDNVIV